jgi:hypothetical protein
MRSTTLSLLALTVLSGACDPQADPNYLGEPLVTLRGHVTSAGSLPPLEAAMLWQRGPPPSTDDQELATRAPVQAGFPAGFTLHLYQPPPAAARSTLAPGQIVYARANASAIPYGIVGAGASGLPASGNPGYGIDAYHWVVYLVGDVPARSLMEWWLSAALPAGFHLLRVTAVDPQCMTPAKLNACAADLVQRGVMDDGTQGPGTARFFCLAPYRLSLAPPGEELVLNLGAVGLPAASGPCP